MSIDSDISGCCGEIIINNTDTFILKAQWFEYRLAHSLQKTFESIKRQWLFSNKWISSPF